MEGIDKPKGIRKFKNLKPPTTFKFNAFPSVAKAVDFRTANCDKCKLCQNPFLEVECPMYLEIQEGLFLGEISMESARRIGMLEPDYQGKCKEICPKNPAFKADVTAKVNAMNQTTLF